MQTTDYDAVIRTSIGFVGIRLNGESVRELKFMADDARLREPRNAMARRTVNAIRRYFEKADNPVGVDLDLQGTDFQRRVWKALRAIPCGQVMTYGALAERLGSGARAVGNACRCNPVPILVPCHRVLARNGLGGFAGDKSGRLMEIKRRLLAHEGVELPAG